MVAERDWKGYEISEEIFEKTPYKVKEFTKLRHVAHLNDARRILEDEILKPQLVYDKSVLRDYRLPVIWLSPNDWYYGPMYGTVSFEFPFDFFLQPDDKGRDRHFYWVEVVDHYKPKALRLILSANNLEKATAGKLVRLEPEEFGQPIFKKDDTWYWLQDYCYEIMIDQLTSLDDCERLFFEEHNKWYCNKAPFKDAQHCNEKNEKRSRRQLICRALALKASTGTRLFDPELKRFAEEHADKFAHEFFTDWLLPEMENMDQKRSLDKRWDSLQLAILAIGEGYEATAKRVLTELGSTDLIVEFLSDRIKAKFGDEAAEQFSETARFRVELFKKRKVKEEAKTTD